MWALLAFVWLLAVHFIADFVCQTHWQASNKSKDNVALSRHVATYTAILAVAALVVVPARLWAPFCLCNGMMHFATDYFTSRWSARYFGKDWHQFFVVIGLDQLIHQATLAGTLAMVLR